MKQKRNKMKEPGKNYNNRITISSLEESEATMRLHTTNMGHEQRMEYLQKLIEITHGNDLSELRNKFYICRIKVNPPDENS